MLFPARKILRWCFLRANGNAIAIADVDATSGQMQVSLSVTNGSLTLGSLTGLTFSIGDGTADTSVSFTGTLADVNSALDGLSFMPTAGYVGSAALQVITSDQGNTGAGGTLTDTDTVNITIGAVNDAPTNSVPGPQTVSEDTSLIFSGGNGNQISVADVDAGGGASA